MLYAPDDLVFKIMSSNSKQNSLKYVYYYEEASERWSGLVNELDRIVSSLLNSEKTNANVTFAAVSSQSPFQAMHVGEDDFVILVDTRTFETLLPLCLRVQSLEALNEIIGAPHISEPRDFSGKFLMDIAKEIVFHTEDPKYLLLPSQPKYIYQAALCFILGHELAHISNGHLNFIKSEGFIHHSNTIEEKELTLKTLEMDADTTATSSVIKVFEPMIEQVRSQNELPQTERDTAERSIRGGYVLGIYIAHLYHDALTLNYLPKAHPITYSRFMISIYVLKRFYSRQFPDQFYLPDDVRKALTDAFASLSGSLDNLCHPIAANTEIYDLKDDKSTYEYQFSGELIALDFLEPLHERWALIRPELEHLQRGGFLARAIV